MKLFSSGLLETKRGLLTQRGPLSVSAVPRASSPPGAPAPAPDLREVNSLLPGGWPISGKLVSCPYRSPTMLFSECLNMSQSLSGLWMMEESFLCLKMKGIPWSTLRSSISGDK